MQNRTACVGDKLLAIVRLGVLDVCVERCNNKSAPRSLIVAANLGKVVRIKNCGVCRGKGKRVVIFLFTRNAVNACYLLEHTRREPLSLFGFGGKNKTLTKQFGKVDLCVLGSRSECLCRYFACIVTKNLINCVKNCTFSVSATAESNNKGFVVNLTDSNSSRRGL